MQSVNAAITFVIFTFNEEKRIERAIRNFVGRGRVLVVDNESTDGTLDIARRYGCDILINKNQGWVEDEITTARVKDAVQTEWIYWGFADEMIDQSSMNAVIAAVLTEKYDIVNIARKDYYYGTFCHDISVDRMNRIFKKKAIDFRGNTIHHFGKAIPGARIHELHLRHFVHHFISNTAKSYLQVMDRYTDMERAEGRPMTNLPRLLLRTGKIFFLRIFVRGGYRLGAPSYFLVCNTVYYHWLSAMKVYERESGLSRDVIEQKNDEIRERILKSFG